MAWAGFFPSVDSGQMRLHVRAHTGTRIEETVKLFDLVERRIREIILPAEVENMLDNIGLPYSSLNTSYANNGTVGPADGDILISLSERHQPTAQYIAELRRTLPDEFPGTLFYFLPSDLVGQILNFGLPAPIDIQVVGRDQEANRSYANKLLQKVKYVPGAVDLRIQQPGNQPKLFINLDRSKANTIG